MQITRTHIALPPTPLSVLKGLSRPIRPRGGISSTLKAQPLPPPIPGNPPRMLLIRSQTKWCLLSSCDYKQNILIGSLYVSPANMAQRQTHKGLSPPKHPTHVNDMLLVIFGKTSPRGASKYPGIVIEIS